MTAVFVLLWLFAVMGLACVVQRIIDAFRRTNRVIKAVPSVLEPTPLRTGHVRLVDGEGGDVA